MKEIMVARKLCIKAVLTMLMAIMMASIMGTFKEGSFFANEVYAEESPIRETDVSSASAGNEIVLLEGGYNYLNKEEILARINEIRLEACKEGVPDPRNKTRSLTESDYVEIKWASDLEWIAQLRAAEATIHMDHGRPNGGRWSDVLHDSVKSNAENIAWNSSASILGGINQWYGEKKDWVNQTQGAVTGHYTSIINPRYTYIGIGAFKPSTGYGAVAGEFKTGSGFNESQAEPQGSCRQKIEVQKSKLTVSLTGPGMVHVGKTATAELNGKTSYENDLGSSWSPRVAKVSLPGETQWKTENSTVATIDNNGLIKGLSAGSTTVKAIYNETEYSATISIEDHKYGEWSVTKEPTCTEKGSRERVCSICKDKNTEEMNAKGHQWEEGNYTVDQEATCTAEGSESLHCSVCQAIKPGSERTIDKTAHNYGEWKVTTEPTCTEKGSRERVCSVCEEKDTEEIDAKGHQWEEGKYTVDQEATCTAEGSESIHCSVCEAIKPASERVIKKAPHNYGEWKVTTEPTCTEKGSRERVCSVCNDKKTEEMDAKGHQWKEGNYTVDQEATCTAEGSESLHCSVCQAIKPGSERTIDKTAHNYGEWKVTTEPTCTEKGSRERVCSVCEEKDTEEIDAKGHQWEEGKYTVDQEATCTAEGSESIHCSVCEAIKPASERVIKKAPHNYGEWKVTKKPTCTEKGSRERVCSVCRDNNKGEIPALDHKWEKGQVTKAATCTTKGEKTISCSRCSAAKTEEIPALGHKWGEGQVTKVATCTTKGEKTISCSRCSAAKTEEIPAAGHKWNKTASTDVKATCTKAGKKSIHCSVCGAVKAGYSGTIPAKGHSWDKGVITRTATTDREGEKTYTCSSCGLKKKESLPKKKPAVSAGKKTPDAANGSDHYVPKGTPSVKKEEKAITVVSDNKEPKNSVFGKLMARAVKSTRTSNKLKWRRVSGANGYIIYGNRCGKRYKYKKLAVVKTATWTHKKLKKGTYYKYIVAAYRNTKEGQYVIAVSKSIHVITKGSKKYTVAKRLKLNKTKVVLKKGKTFKLKAKEVPLVKKRKIQHHRRVAFESGNKNVATVTAKGKIRAKAKGTCKIYVYAENGLYKKVTVKVK